NQVAAFLNSYNSGSLTQGCDQVLITKASNNSELQPVPDGYSLEQNRPNPFYDQSLIRYHLPAAAHVQLTIYDASGRKVATLVDEFQNAGDKYVRVEAKNLVTGVYYYKLSAKHKSVPMNIGVRKMILV